MSEMKKTTLTRTRFIVNDSEILSIFEFDGDGKTPLIINNESVEYLRDYVEERVENAENPQKILSVMSRIEEELNTVDEVQIARE